jgi:hypothetical protein
MVAEFPRQMTLCEEVTESEGGEIIVTLIVLVLIQLVAFDPVTVYIVVTVGLTTTLVPVSVPGFQV